MLLIDTHCHLVSDKLKNSLPVILERAKKAGVGKIINIAYDPQTIKLAQEQLKISEMLYVTLGIQPHDATKYNIEEAEKVRSIAINNIRVVGIGEIGLDAHYTLSPMEKQIECFEYFLQMALELKLPVVVHVRDTHEEVYSRIKLFAEKGLTGVIHCFTGSLDEAKDFLDCGMHLSFSGIVTFKNTQNLQEVAKFVPENRILIETDSPYLAPVPLRGKINEPAFVHHTCEFISKIRNIKYEELANLTTQNAENLFYRMRSSS
jgi:TatD DNase family protein